MVAIDTGPPLPPRQQRHFPSGLRRHHPHAHDRDHNVMPGAGRLDWRARGNAALVAEDSHGDAEAPWLGALLASRDRRLGAPTAPAGGLYLSEVQYAADLAFPAPPGLPVWRAR